MARVHIEETFPGELRELTPERRARFVLRVKAQLEDQLGLTDLLAKARERGGEVAAVDELVEHVQRAFEARHKRLVDDVVRVVREGTR